MTPAPCLPIDIIVSFDSLLQIPEEEQPKVLNGSINDISMKVLSVDVADKEDTPMLSSLKSDSNQNEPEEASHK